MRYKVTNQIQENSKQKTSNNKHKQPTLKLDKSQMTKSQKQVGGGGETKEILMKNIGKHEAKINK